MNPERYKKVDQVFQQAVSLSPDERNSFLQEACAGDEELRREVESLLEHDREAGSFIDLPASQVIAVDEASHLDPDIVGRTFLHYRIVEKIGEGGMGEVFLAEDTSLNRKVALKFLPPEMEQDTAAHKRLIREAHAAAALDHPYICHINEIAGAEGKTFIVMEYVEGVTLKDRLGRGALPLKEAEQIAVEIAEALEAAHGKGIIHRDIKPANIMITKAGHAKVMDFGLAKLTRSRVAGAEASRSLSGETRPGIVLGTVGYMAPEQIRAQGIDHRTDIFAFGCMLYEMLSGRRAFQGATVADTISAILAREPAPLLRAGEPLPPALEKIVRRCLEKRPDDRFSSAKDLGYALEAVAEVWPRESVRPPEEPKPYPGLASFTEEDAERFFGREDEVAALWRKIPEQPILALIGPSGSGKTSFVRAGIVPHVPPGWRRLVTNPGRAPFAGLARALAPAFSGDPEAFQKLLEFDNPEVALSLVTRWRERLDYGLIIVDQFEELFTLNGEDVQRRFAELLGRIAALKGVHVLLSMRDDFFFQCSAYPPLSGVFSTVTPLRPLTPAALAEALVRPAECFAFVFEDGLVEEMVESVEGERGALPLLAFAVARLWEERDREKKLLTREGYERVGGVAGALAHHAEATLERIGTERASIVREFFRNLVTAERTRCAGEVEELLSLFPEDRRDDVRQVLAELVDARLLTCFEAEAPDGGRHSRVEVVHESLFQRWPRLARWLAQDADGALLRDQLKQAAHLWEEKGKPKDLLWTGSSFREYELWRERYPGALTGLEEEFGQSMTTRARRRKRLGRAAMVAGLLVLAAIALVIGVYWQRAVRSAHLAEASKLLALAELRLSDDPTEALALATASLEEADTKQVRTFVMKTLWDAPPAMEIGATAGVRAPAFSPDGKWLAAPTHGSEVPVWGQDGKTRVILPGHETRGESPTVAQWASNDLLVTGLPGSLPKRVHVWSMPGGERLRTIDLQRPFDWQVAPRRLLVEVWEGESGNNRLALRSWSLPNGEAQNLDIVNWKNLRAAWSTFAPDGNAWLYSKGRDIYKHPLPAGAGSDGLFAQLGTDLASLSVSTGRLVLADKAGEIQVWHYQAGQVPEPRAIRAPGGASAGAQLDNSERWMYELDGRKLRLRGVAAWPSSRPVDLRRNTSWYGSAVDVHPAGEWAVASTSSMGRLTMWPLRRAAPMIIDGYRGRVVFSPDSRWLATACAERGLRLWPLPGHGGNEVRTLSLPAGEEWIAMTIDRAGRSLFLVPAGGHVIEVAPLDGGPPRQLQDPSAATDEQISAVAVSPSGRLVAGASYFGQAVKTLRIWNLDTGEAKRFVLPAAPDSAAGESGGSLKGTGYERGVTSLAFADESTLYAAGDGGLWRWDVEKGAHEIAAAAPGGCWVRARFSEDARQALIDEIPLRGPRDCQQVLIYDTRARTSRPLPGLFGECYNFLRAVAIDNSGAVAAVAGPDGGVRVARLTADAPHLLVGHKGRVDSVAISPDLRWVATTGEDNTLRLWPMPDLSKPPLHALPHDALVAKLKSLTNFRATRDPSSPDGWKIEIGPFPGWAEVPEW